LHQTIENIGAGGVGKRRELVEGPLRLFERGVTENRGDQDRSLALGARG